VSVVGDGLQLNGAGGGVVVEGLPTVTVSSASLPAEFEHVVHAEPFVHDIPNPVVAVRAGDVQLPDVGLATPSFTHPVEAPLSEIPSDLEQDVAPVDDHVSCAVDPELTDEVEALKLHESVEAGVMVYETVFDFVPSGNIAHSCHVPTVLASHEPLSPYADQLPSLAVCPALFPQAEQVQLGLFCAAHS